MPRECVRGRCSVSPTCWSATWRATGTSGPDLDAQSFWLSSLATQRKGTGRAEVLRFRVQSFAGSGSGSGSLFVLKSRFRLSHPAAEGDMRAAECIEAVLWDQFGCFGTNLPVLQMRCDPSSCSVFCPEFRRASAKWLHAHTSKLDMRQSALRLEAHTHTRTPSST